MKSGLIRSMQRNLEVSSYETDYCTYYMEYEDLIHAG